MLKILSRITRRDRAEIKDARRIYQIVMAQSRQPKFYGQYLCADTTDGRMEILCLHVSTIIYALRSHGDTGAKLTQAIYDVMIDDFDVALREEGLADTGVSRRIKPLAQMFFVRAKQYADAFDMDGDNMAGDSQAALEALIGNEVCKADDKIGKFADYTKNFLVNLSNQSLGQIAQANIEFPEFH